MKTYTKAVSATLAGALAVGMVPAMALADTPDAELELMVSPTEAINGGSIVLASGQAEGQSFDAVSQNGCLVPVAAQPLDGSDYATQLTVTEVWYYKLCAAGTGSDGAVFRDGGAKFWYDEYGMFTPGTNGLVFGNSGTIDDLTKLTAGTYVVGVKAKFADNSAEAYVLETAKFTVTAGEVAGLEFYDYTNGAIGTVGYDIEDETITFSNQKLALGDAANEGLGLKVGSTDVTDSFHIGLVKDDKGKVVPAWQALKYAGTYNVQVIGNDDTKYEGISQYITLTINPIDISKLSVVLGSVETADVIAANPKAEPGILLVNGETDLVPMLVIDSVPVDYAAPGTYTARVGAAPYVADSSLDATENAAAKALYEKSIYGTVPADFLVAGKVNQEIKVFYGSNEIVPGSGVEIEVDYSDPAKATAFDASAISVDYKKIGAVDYTDAADADEVITYMKQIPAGWEPCSADALANSGVYKVSVSLKPTAEQAFEVITFDVTVTHGNLTDGNVSVTNKGAGVYNNSTTNRITADYDGTDLMEDLGITVRDGKGAVVSSSDYAVTILNTKDKMGKDVPAAKQAVSEIVEQGEYTIVVKSTKYNLDVKYYAKVNAETVYPWVIGSDEKDATKRHLGVTYYTGKAIDPIAKFTSKETVDNVPNTHVETAFDVDAAEYKVTITEFKPAGKNTVAKPVPTEIKDAGVYKLTISEIANGNVTVVDSNCMLTVTKEGPFTDVPSDAWYAQVVAEAKAARVVNGIEGTTLFAPDRATTRGEFVGMLFNLAGGINDGKTTVTTVVTDPNTNETITTVVTTDTAVTVKPFGDVAVDAWYAKAVTWAKAAGIANGDAGKDTFRPNDPMTRQEGIAFIANFAEAYGVDVDVLAADVAAELAKYPDGAKVSGWAEEVVAWACINDVAGNGKVLNPLGKITRAESAAMLMNYKAAFIDKK